jgi:SnoaL-like domain
MSTPEDIARAFLAAIEARDLQAAEALVAPGFTMVFPGNKRHQSLEALFASSNNRYRKVGKKIDGFDALDGPGRAVIYCYGTLYGQWPDGTAFDGIRYIDRFEIVDGKITAQAVWNDSGEARIERKAQG